jgi:hypothetical protein
MLTVMIQVMIKLHQNIHKALKIKHRYRKPLYTENIACHVTSFTQIIIFREKRKRPNILIRHYTSRAATKGAQFI